MADSSLDDFFAKKDKSKKKSKASKLTPGDILAKGEEPVKKEKKTKKEKEKTQLPTEPIDPDAPKITTFTKEEEDKWKEVEEEEEKDYSGLRIANLQISEKEPEESEEQSQNVEGEEDEDGEPREKKDAGQQGPWKGPSSNPAKVQAAPAPVEEAPPQPKEEAPKTTGKYVPPGQRAAAAAAASGSPAGPTLPSHLRRKKNAPNLRSEEEFPTLGGAPMPMYADSDTRNFERVQYGGKQMDDPSKARQELSLGNKFSALQD